jgi:hypothetical protein
MDTLKKKLEKLEGSGSNYQRFQEPGKGFNALNTWKAEWVRANASLIKEVGAEKWLSQLLGVLKAHRDG